MARQCTTRHHDNNWHRTGMASRSSGIHIFLGEVDRLGLDLKRCVQTLVASL